MNLSEFPRPLEASLPSLEVATQEPKLADDRWRLAKRCFDLALGLPLIVVTLPLMAIIAIAIKLDTAGPVIYRQRRPGRDGRPFSLLKFRTMAVGSDGANGGPVNGIHPKLPEDSRVTWTGRWLRRSSMDELPQLFNVLGGSMSLVGPRPLLLTERPFGGEAARQRLLVQPGMTGLWQISGRSDLPIEERLRLDLAYIWTWSLWLDIRILMRTLGAVLRPRGAY